MQANSTVESQSIRIINFHGIEIGGENEILTSRPILALELNIFDF